ncbi:hypothetical protein [Mucilaginibacter sp.]|uniref:hypothetical protein n=1 Tax=Mucilaginibacter sp. TaxID=1882438 RepID=UPI0025FC77E3|nr:hypothetical protein [Mucilaginibacter sp.]
MKKQILTFCVIAFAYFSCSKEHISIQKSSYNISIKAVGNDAATDSSSSWAQVLGGNATITFDAKYPSDTMTVSSVTHTIDLGKLSTYQWKLFAGKYDITLATADDAVVSPYVRFSASKTGVDINTDGVIGMDVDASDGVITIKRTLLDTTVSPTFKPTGAAVANLSNANGYAYLYVKGSTSGQLVFTSTEGDVYKADITVVAKSQFDASLKTNSKGQVVIQSYPFHPKTNVQ